MRGMQSKNSKSGSSSKTFICSSSKSKDGSPVLDCVPVDDESQHEQHDSSSSSSDSSHDDPKTYDVIIIGAGTAGAVTAKYISDNRKLKVLVLEAGENQNEYIASKYPLGPAVAGPNGDPENKYGFVERHGINLVQPAFNPRTTDSIAGSDIKGRMDIPGLNRVAHAGRNWGGASAHHYLAAFMTSSQFDQKLADEYGNSSWGASNINAVKRSLEKYVPLDGAVGEGGRGANGPLVISKLPDGNVTYIDSIQAALVDPVVNKPTDLPGPVDTPASAPLVSDINKPGLTTVRVTEINQYLDFTDVTRTHSGEAFLGPDVVDQVTGRGVGNRRLLVISKATVNKILFENKIAKWVEVIIDGECVTFMAKKKIIISAGSLRTPGILERSGVGDAQLLTSLGIPVVLNSPFVGNNLTNQIAHLSFINIAPGRAVPQASEAAHLEFPGKSPYGLDRYATHRMIGGPVRAFEPYYPSETWLQEYGANISSPATIINLTINESPTSRGSIHIINSDPFAPPDFIRNYLTSAEDIRFGREIHRMDKRLEAQLAVTDPSLQFKVVMPPPSVNFNDDAQIERWMSALAFATDHYMGTAKMGKTAATSVVSPTLHVHGLKNLMVGDLSIMPIPTDASTAFQAMVIGKMAANFALASI